MLSYPIVDITSLAHLGHEKIQTTLSTYSHLYPNKHQEVVDMIQNQYRKDMATSDVNARQKHQKNQSHKAKGSKS